MLGNSLKNITDKAQSIIDKRKYDEAIECFDKALSIEPKNDDLLFKKSLLLYEICRYSEVLEAFDKILEMDPKDVETLFKKGCCLYDLDRYPEAIEVIARF